ncbi:MAG: ABC transporter substrate-binding protein [Bilophila wadsworthia]
MGFKRSFVGICLVLLALAWSTPARSVSPIPMKTAWLGEHETFAVWYAKQKGWDKEAGLDLTMLRFDSGKAIVEACLPTIGPLPVVGLSRAYRNTERAPDIIAVAMTNPPPTPLSAPTARSSASREQTRPILTSTAIKPRLGKKYSVRKRSAHYMMAAWLKSLGLEEKDVRVKYMSPVQALGAFAGGLGDVVALWAPLTYDADAKGFKPAALSGNCGVSQPVLIVANHEYAIQYPERVEAFLKMYLRVITFMRETPVETLVPDYVRFYEEWTGRKLTSEIAAKDLANHAVFNLEEQLALFDDAQGKSKLQNWLTDIAAFYESIGMVRKEDRQRLRRMNAVTDDYLKALR